MRVVLAVVSMVGAIGVSGSRGKPEAPGGAADTKCAQAGIERIA